MKPTLELQNHYFINKSKQHSLNFQELRGTKLTLSILPASKKTSRHPTLNAVISQLSSSIANFS